MIKAVFFDFYNTLVKFWPPLEQIQQITCQEFGLNVSAEAITRGYAVADVLFNRENEIRPLALRSEQDRLEFFTKYEKMILENAGLSVTSDLARRIWEMASSVPKEFTPFGDTVTALSQLHADGYQLGIISNLRRDMSEICQRLGIGQYLDFVVSSEDAGAEKPNASIFMAALERATVAPEEAVHVGDQHRSDVLGARAVGIHPVLIDRGGWHPNVNDCTKIATLDELAPVLAGAPQSLKTADHKSSAP
ncbi:MAG: HAD family hydrolase [Chloroflexi bacterium]|nr:HAD family hydrolase [Chloroflexota bacterium]MCH8897684.1 HAD family hydrolase [Chloroflexota bacterium]